MDDVVSQGGGGEGVSQNLSSVTNDSFCYKLLKYLLLIGYQQICHWYLSFVIEKKRFVKLAPFAHEASFRLRYWLRQSSLWWK